jgi:hypothetical protein
MGYSPDFSPVSSYAEFHGTSLRGQQKTERIDIQNLVKLFFREVVDRREFVEAGGVMFRVGRTLTWCQRGEYGHIIKRYLGQCRGVVRAEGSPERERRL